MENKIKIYIRDEEFEVDPGDVIEDFRDELIEIFNKIADEIYFTDYDYNNISEDEKIEIKYKLEKMVFYLMANTALHRNRDVAEQIQSDVDDFIEDRIQEGYWEE